MSTAVIGRNLKPPKKFPKLKQFWANVGYLQGQNEINNSKMAKIMGMSVATFQNRKNKVQATTGEELEKASEYFGIPLEQMMLPFKPVVVKAYEEADNVERYGA